MTTPQEDMEKLKAALDARFPSSEEIWTRNLMDDFTDMRVIRAEKLAEIYDFTDPLVMTHMLGDMVTIIENIHIATNPMPADGFVSLTPGDKDGSGK